VEARELLLLPPGGGGGDAEMCNELELVVLAGSWKVAI
jgi:hypothetical protein